MNKQLKAVVCAAVLSAVATVSHGASIFLTGHDPDFHATLGGNTTGAININKAAIGFISDPTYNPFAASGASKFLFVESSIAPPSGHTLGVNGIVASGYVAGTDFEKHDASDLSVELGKLGTKYDAIVVASDFGGVLTSAELNILNSRSSDIIKFLNAGGGIYAMAESNSQAHLTDGSTPFGYLPFVVTSTQLNQSESGFTVTPFGASLGLTANDINGNASHNVFVTTGGLNIVDQDSSGHILTIAGRLSEVPTVPEPSTMLMLAAGLACLGWTKLRKSS